MLTWNYYYYYHHLLFIVLIRFDSLILLFVEQLHGKSKGNEFKRAVDNFHKANDEMSRLKVKWQASPMFLESGLDAKQWKQLIDLLDQRERDEMIGKRGKGKKKLTDVDFKELDKLMSLTFKNKERGGEGDERWLKASLTEKELVRMGAVLPRSLKNHQQKFDIGSGDGGHHGGGGGGGGGAAALKLAVARIVTPLGSRSAEIMVMQKEQRIIEVVREKICASQKNAMQLALTSIHALESKRTTEQFKRAARVLQKRIDALEDQLIKLSTLQSNGGGDDNADAADDADDVADEKWKELDELKSKQATQAKRAIRTRQQANEAEKYADIAAQKVKKAAKKAYDEAEKQVAAEEEKQSGGGGGKKKVKLTNPDDKEQFSNNEESQEEPQARRQEEDEEHGSSVSEDDDDDEDSGNEEMSDNSAADAVFSHQQQQQNGGRKPKVLSQVRRPGHSVKKPPVAYKNNKRSKVGTQMTKGDKAAVKEMVEEEPQARRQEEEEEASGSDAAVGSMAQRKAKVAAAREMHEQRRRSTRDINQAKKKK
jgi:hypothetical protein